MISDEIAVNYGKNQQHFRLPDTYREFVQYIKEQFNLSEFEAEVHFRKNKPKLCIEQESSYRNLKRQNFNEILEIEIKDVQNNYSGSENLEFFETFIQQEAIECCVRRDCPLCNGNGQAIIVEQDKELINQYVRQRLQERMDDISTKLFHRYQLKLKTPENFLTYHKQQREVSLDQFTLLPNPPNIFKAFTLPNLYSRQQSFSQINQKEFHSERQDKYSVKLLNKIDEITAEPYTEKMIELSICNDGVIDWPKSMVFLCSDGPFCIKSDVRSLKIKEKYIQPVKIFIPKVIGRSKFSCRFGYHQDQQNISYFGDKIKFIINVVSPELPNNKSKINYESAQKQQPQRLEQINENSTPDSDCDEENRKLIPLVRSQSEQMGFEPEMIEQKIKQIFEKSKYRKLTIETFFNQLWQD